MRCKYEQKTSQKYTHELKTVVTYMCKVDKTDVHTYTLVIYAYQEKWQL